MLNTPRVQFQEHLQSLERGVQGLSVYTEYLGQQIWPTWAGWCQPPKLETFPSGMQNCGARGGSGWEGSHPLWDVSGIWGLGFRVSTQARFSNHHVQHATDKVLLSG